MRTVNLEYTKQVLLSIFCNAMLIIGGFLLIDLYIPIKKAVSGVPLSGEQWLSYINLSKRYPMIIALSVIFFLYRANKKHRILQQNNHT